MKNRAITLIAIAGLSWSALPAVAAVEAADTSITITNDTEAAASYWVQIHDGDRSFTLEPGESKVFNTVPSLDRVYWSVAENGVPVASGTMTPAPHGGDPLPDEVVAADVYRVEIISDDTDMIRTAPVVEESDAVLIPPLVLIAGRWAL